MFLLFLFVTKMFTTIFFTLARPTKLKLTHSIGTMLNSKYLAKEAVMVTTQRREGPFSQQNGLQDTVPL